MLAGQIVAPGQIRLIEVPEPRFTTSSGEIIFQPEQTCLCGSDLPYFDDAFDGDPATYPRQIGHSLHEMVGRVIATNGSRYKVGDRVLTVPVNQVGLFERYAVSEDRAIPLDTRVPAEQALMAQPLGTVIFALKKLPRIMDQDVVIVGQGPIGHLFDLALRNLGAREIIVIDKLESRLKLSRSHGATQVICSAKDDPVEAVRTITRGKGPDIVIEAVGHKDQTLNLCIDLSRLGGQILYFGVPPLRIHDIAWYELFRKNLTIYSSVNPDFERDFPLAMRWIGEGRINVASLITHRFKLAQIQQAFEAFRDRDAGALKVNVDFPTADRA
jgi:threonine dehydrogenase-like Zn-dependent dehydrogenase